MDVKGLRNLNLERINPQNINVGRMQQVETPKFEIPNLNNNSVDFDFSSESSQDIAQQNQEISNNLKGLRTYDFSMNTKDVSLNAPNMGTKDVS